MNRESDVGNQPGDSRTREGRKLAVNVQPKVAKTEKQEPMVGNQEDPSVFGLSINQWCVFLVETAVTGSTGARK